MFCGLWDLKNLIYNEEFNQKKVWESNAESQRHAIEVFKTVQVSLSRPGLYLLELMSWQERRRVGIS